MSRSPSHRTRSLRSNRDLSGSAPHRARTTTTTRVKATRKSQTYPLLGDEDLRQPTRPVASDGSPRHPQPPPGPPLPRPPARLDRPDPRQLPRPSFLDTRGPPRRRAVFDSTSRPRQLMQTRNRRRMPRRKTRCSADRWETRTKSSRRSRTSLHRPLPDNRPLARLPLDPEPLREGFPLLEPLSGRSRPHQHLLLRQSSDNPSTRPTRRLGRLPPLPSSCRHPRPPGG